MKLQIDIRYLFLLTLSFIVFTAVGTLSHEMGHLSFAKYLDYETKLHYGSVEYENSRVDERLGNLYRANKTAIDNGAPFEQKDEYEKVVKESQANELVIAIGGPLQTTLTGTIGGLILLFRRKEIRMNGLKLLDWLLVFLTLFWLRQVFNVVMSVGSELRSPDGSYFGGDEEYISDVLHLWPGTVSTILGSIGLVISAFIVFRVVPRPLRLTFVLSGLIGGVLGFIVWMNILGPKLLP